MTDKEFKRLTRAQLIEIIYKLQIQADELNERNKELENALADKRLRMDKVGDLAEAALEINDCFRNAQNAAEQYLKEIKTMRDETEAQRDRILFEARVKADRIVAEAQKTYEDRKNAIEMILKEYKRSHSNNG